MLDACSNPPSLPRGKPQLRSCLPFGLPYCQGSRGPREAKCKTFSITLIHYSSWLCVHLERYNILTGFWNSYKGNLVHILISQYLLVGDRGCEWEPRGSYSTILLTSLQFRFFNKTFSVIWRQVCLWIEACDCAGFKLYSFNTLNLKEVTLSAVRK